MAKAENPQPPAGRELLASPRAGGMVVRGSLLRLAANLAGIAVGVGTAALILRHLGTVDTGRYVTVLSLVAIPVAVGDVALTVAGSRELALAEPRQRGRLVANMLGQRLVAMPVAVGLAACFAIAAGYTPPMVYGTLLAGFGATLVSAGNALLLPLTVELRNLGLAAVELAKQVVTLIGAAALVALGASLTPFYGLLIAAGAVTLAAVVVVLGRDGLRAPRLQPAVQRRLLASALPQAAAMGLSQVYFRIVIIVMSVIASGRQTGYFAGSLRALEAGIQLPVVVAAVALPLLAHAAEAEPQRLRYAVRLLSQGMVVAGVAIVIVAVHWAAPVMAAIGGSGFRPAGAVLRVQVGALVFVALDQIWAAALLALGRQRELILTNGLAALALGGLAAALVPPFGAVGGAVASVGGEAVLGALIYWRLRRHGGPMLVGLGFGLRLAAAAAPACALLAAPAIPGTLDGAAAGLLFLVLAQLFGAVPAELHEALGLGGRGRALAERALAVYPGGRKKRR